MHAPIRTLPIDADTPPGGGAPGLQRGEPEPERERRHATHPMTDPTGLHRLYLASLGGDGITMEPAWAMALAASFGSVARWREAFVAIGKTLGGGAGWVLLCFQPREGTLVHQWTTGHAAAGGVPILALDLGEHARHMDDGASAAACVDDFIARIDWAGVYARYQAAVHAASEPFAAAQDEVAGRLLLDVRRAGVYAQATQLIAGARWCDPAQVARWAAELPAGREVLVYCVYGHEVGRATALRLRAAGIDARFLRGGIDAWKAAGRPLADKPPA